MYCPLFFNSDLNNYIKYMFLQLFFSSFNKFNEQINIEKVIQTINNKVSKFFEQNIKNRQLQRLHQTKPITKTISMNELTHIF